MERNELLAQMKNIRTDFQDSYNEDEIQANINIIPSGNDHEVHEIR